MRAATGTEVTTEAYDWAIPVPVAAGGVVDEEAGGGTVSGLWSQAVT